MYGVELFVRYHFISYDVAQSLNHQYDSGYLILFSKIFNTRERKSAVGAEGFKTDHTSYDLHGRSTYIHVRSGHIVRGPDKSRKCNI